MRNESSSRDLVLKTSTKEVLIGFFVGVNERQQFEKSSRDISAYEVN